LNNAEKKLKEQQKNSAAGS